MQSECFHTDVGIRKMAELASTTSQFVPYHAQVPNRPFPSLLKDVIEDSADFISYNAHYDEFRCIIDNDDLNYLRNLNILTYSKI